VPYTGSDSPLKRSVRHVLTGSHTIPNMFIHKWSVLSLLLGRTAPPHWPVLISRSAQGRRLSWPVYRSGCRDEHDHRRWDSIEPGPCRAACRHATTATHYVALVAVSAANLRRRLCDVIWRRRRHGILPR